MRAKTFNYLKCLFAFLLLMGLSNVMVAQQTISGAITDEAGEALPFANVFVEGTTIGTTTDIDGNYSLKIPEGATNLVVSFTGYTDQVLPIGSGGTLNCTMQEGTILDEVVVIGYGSVKKSDATGAVVSVGADDFNKGVISSPEQLLQGRAAGVQITSSSGEPGAGINMRIRGTSSVRNGNNPLFVVDGVPLSGGDSGGGGADGGLGSSAARNPLNFLNPNDIQSIDILKDASATAIYGSRGANGVVIITTKKGTEGKGSLSYDYSLGISNISKKYDLLTGSEYLEAWSFFNPSANVADQNFGGDTDWQDEIFRTGITHNHNVSYGGSSAKGDYLFSLGYQDQEGVVENSGMKRISARFNGSRSFIDDRLKVSTQLALADVHDDNVPITDNSGFEGDLIAAALKFNPTVPVADSDGNPIQFSLTEPNPRAILDYTRSFTNTLRGLASMTGELAITNDLSFTSRLGYDRSISKRKDAFSGNLVASGIWDGQSDDTKKGRLFINDVEGQNTLWENFLTYSKKLSGAIDFSALVGYSYQEFRSGNNSIEMTNFRTENLDQMLNNYAAVDVRADNSIVPTNSEFYVDELQSYYGRLNLGYMDKYLVTATVRTDGSTKFGSGNQYGIFPSFALKWRIAEEGFVGDAVDDLSFRIGYGITGNQEFGHNLFTDRQRYGNWDIDNGGNVNGGDLSQVAFANENLKWESTAQFNAGLDFAVANYRLSGTLDFYRKNTNDLLIQLVSAQPAPNPFVWTNLDADVINQGVELGLNYLALDKGDFSWEIQANVAYNKNTVQNLGGLVINTGAINGQGLTGAFAQRIAEGQPLYAFFLREFTGYSDDGAVQLYEGGDVQKFTGASPLPVWNTGITNSFKYGDLSFSFFFTGQFGHHVYSNTGNAFFTAGSIGGGRNVSQATVDQSLFGDPNGENRTNAPDVSTRFLEKADFMRLQNVTLAYSLKPNTDLVRGIRLFVTGQNLALFTGYSGQDPEVNTNKQIDGVPSFGIDYTSYPRARTITVGANVTF